MDEWRISTIAVARAQPEGESAYCARSNCDGIMPSNHIADLSGGKAPSPSNERLDGKIAITSFSSFLYMRSRDRGDDPSQGDGDRQRLLLQQRSSVCLERA